MDFKSTAPLVRQTNIAYIKNFVCKPMTRTSKDGDLYIKLFGTNPLPNICNLKHRNQELLFNSVRALILKMFGRFKRFCGAVVQWYSLHRFARLYEDSTTDCLTVDPSEKKQTGRIKALG